VTIPAQPTDSLALQVRYDDTIPIQCVGKPSYAEAVRGTRGTMMSQSEQIVLPVTEPKITNLRGKVQRKKVPFVVKYGLYNKSNLDESHDFTDSSYI
jgi:hypothetical protein